MMPKPDNLDVSALQTLPFRVLSLLARRGPTIGNDMIPLLDGSAATISRAANLLERAGMVTKTVAADDKRCIVFTISGRGRAVNARVRALVRIVNGHKDTDNEHTD